MSLSGSGDCGMTKTLIGVLLAGSAFLFPSRLLSQGRGDRPLAAIAAGTTPDLPALPAAPAGKSTVLGGDIRVVDSVRDELTLDALGMRPMKIRFDERTRVFRDGQKISLLELRPAKHASVQTVLDGDKVFAVSIHVLSDLPESNFDGRIASYRPGTGELTIASGDAGETLTVLVPGDASIAREGQRAFSSAQSGIADLRTGTLVSVRFRPDGNGHGISDQVSILATPGADFVFTGRILDIDMHAGFLSLVTSQEGRSFRISFDAAQAAAIAALRRGDSVRLTARYDGAHYAATGISPQ